MHEIDLAEPVNFVLEEQVRLAGRTVPLLGDVTPGPSRESSGAASLTNSDIHA